MIPGTSSTIDIAVSKSRGLYILSCSHGLQLDRWRNSWPEELEDLCPWGHANK